MQYPRDDQRSDRETFTTSRELEYFSEAELTTQTGYGREDWWPGVAGKELIDNALDACEQAGVAPRIKVEFEEGSLTVSDNGPGIPLEVINRIIDFSSRTSDKAAYVSPTRGGQGNALKTILGIAYVLGGGSPGRVEVESAGIRHILTISSDQILQRPRIDHQQAEIVKTTGTSIRVSVDLASRNEAEQEPEFLQNLVRDYSLYNPHACFELLDHGEGILLDSTATGWRKWLPTDPTSAHWYNQERLETLIGSYVAGERDGGRARTAREFASEFRGLSGSAKQKAVAERAGLERAYLHDLAANGRFDRRAVARLLSAMQALSAPVKPEALGVLGRHHFEQRFQAQGETFRYTLKKGIDERGLPFLIECAFGMTSESGLRTGLNWSVPLGNPIQDDVFNVNGHEVWGIDALLEHQRINLDRDPVCLAIHLACPRFRFLDRGKGSLTLGSDDDDEGIRTLLAEPVVGATKEWSRIKKQQERDRRAAERSWERYEHGHSSKVTVKDAAYAVMLEAYREASGGGGLWTHARQIMYSARRVIQEKTGETLSDTYFTQTLLPDFIREHPDETKSWRVAYDDRGHLQEPHTGTVIGIGTVSVQQYLKGAESTPGLGIETPFLSSQFPTSGPRNRYAGVLFIEKEGFLPLLEQMRFGERYDLAIASSKGMSSTACRTLFENLNVPIYCLHDFDVAGFNILGTLTRDTQRYKFTSAPNVIDLGLRLADVKKWKLQSEAAARSKSDPTSNLRENGATEEEIEFLKKQRVELNSFSSPQFVRWLDSKLVKAGAKKVIPDKKILEQAYRRGAAMDLFQEKIDAAGKEAKQYAEGLAVPRDLKQQVRAALRRNPALAWDEALHLPARR